VFFDGGLEPGDRRLAASLDDLGSEPARIVPDAPKPTLGLGARGGKECSAKLRILLAKRRQHVCEQLNLRTLLETDSAHEAVELRR